MGARLVYGLRVAILLPALLFLLANPATGAQKRLPAKPIDLNSATVEQLQQLPGIGPSTAQEIDRFRKKSGRFERVEDLLAIHGISKAKLEKLRPYVTIKRAGKPAA